MNTMRVIDSVIAAWGKTQPGFSKDRARNLPCRALQSRVALFVPLQWPNYPST